MKRVFVFFVALTLHPLTLPTAHTQQRQPVPAPKFFRVAEPVPGEYIVVLKEEEVSGSEVEWAAS